MITVTFEGSAAEVLSEMQVFLKNTAAPKGSTVEVTPEKITIASTAAPQISKVKIPDSVRLFLAGAGHGDCEKRQK